MPLLVLSPTSAVIQTYCQFERSREQCSISTALDVTHLDFARCITSRLRSMWQMKKLNTTFSTLLLITQTRAVIQTYCQFERSREQCSISTALDVTHLDFARCITSRLRSMWQMKKLNTTFSTLLLITQTRAVIQTYCQFERSRELCSISTALDVTHLDFAGCMTSRLRSMWQMKKLNTTLLF